MLRLVRNLVPEFRPPEEVNAEALDGKLTANVTA
jgi:hypothetical protein